MARGVDDGFPVKPDTTEYEVLSFLVAHDGDAFTLAEIAARIDISRSRVFETMANLHRGGLVARSAEAYSVAPDRADKLKQRLKSLDQLSNSLQWRLTTPMPKKAGRKTSRASNRINTQTRNV